MNKKVFQSKLLVISVIFLFILLISSDVLPQRNVSAENDIEKLIQEGKELYKNGEYREAIVKFLEAKDLARTKEDISEVYFNLSSAYYASNQSVEAKEYLQKSLEILPERTIDALYYSPGFVEMFNTTKAESIKLKEKRPVVKVKPGEEKKVKKGGKGLLLVIGALAAAGAVAVLLLGKKGNGRGNGTPAPVYGSIQVNSSPTGAQVFLDGSDTGSTTNTTLTNVSPGSHTVSLIMEGYEDEQTSVSVTAGQTATVSVTLTKPTITITDLTSSTIWTTGEEVEIKWQTSGSGSSQGIASTGAGLNPLINQGKRALSRFQRRAFQERRFLRSAIKERRNLEGVDSSGNRGKLSSNTSEPQGISGEISSSVKEGDIVHKRAKDIRDIKRMSRVRIINAPVVPQISSGKFMPSGDIRVLALSYVKIDLYKRGYFDQTIVSSTDNDGSYTWTVDSSLEDGTDYKVRISSTSDSSVYGDSEEFEIRNFRDIEWVQVPAGNFQMGDNFNEGGSNELPVHTVYHYTYYISKYEVTFDQYDAFCDATGRSKPSDAGWGRGLRPVINVSWDDTKAFCDWLSAKTGENIHLPTEAQWEKAARETDQRRYPWGNDSPDSSLVNYNYNVNNTMPVGSYPSGVSPYGIHDMAGNVWEWCSDWYDYNYYSSSPTNNPQGPSSGSYRVLRGGGWWGNANSIRSAFRYYFSPSYGRDDFGFRLCKDVFTEKSITVTEPTSSTVWTKGHSADITWTSTGTISDVKIDLYKGGTFNQTIVSSTTNNGSYTWTEVDTSLVDSSDYKVRISDSSNYGVYGESAQFTIEEKSITVTGPTSSTIWTTGDSADITWTSTGTISDVKIDLYKGGTFNQTIISSIANDGSHAWDEVDETLEDGTDYKVKVSLVDSLEVYDDSEEFEIISFPDIEWVQVPSGTFEMGDNFEEGSSDERPVHTVYLDTYYISKYEVTFEQYDAFCDATGRAKPDDFGWGRGDRPVIYVNYADSTAFCNWLSEVTGENIHLPTEAQWEKAARGTDQRRYPWGNDSPDSSLANYDENVMKTVPVGSYPSGVSPYGIHDMAGNVLELCSDWFNDNYYSISPKDNPQGPSTGSRRVMRGGAYYHYAGSIRSAVRGSIHPDNPTLDTGIRLCKD